MSEKDPQAPPPGSVFHMATPILSVKAQIGSHVMGALEHDGVVAVLARMVPGIESDQVVSIPITAEQFEAIQQVLSNIPHVPHQEEEEHHRRIGFQFDGEE